MPDASASKSHSPEALELKRRGRRRLLGAVVIALLLVVFVPMVLDSEPRKAAKEIALTIPAKEGQPPLPVPGATPVKPAPKPAEPAPVIPKAEEASATPEAKLAPKTETAAVPAVPVAPPAPAKPEPKTAEVKPAEVKAVETKPAPEAKVAPKPDPKTPPKPEPKADPKKLEGFVVQLGAFSEGETVKQLVAKLKAAKIPVFTEQIKGESGTLTRVRAGPYKTRELADKGLVQVKKAGADGKVVPLP
jgi:DedD protein